MSQEAADRVRDAIRVKHYWIRRYILVHNQRHPSQMGAADAIASSLQQFQFRKCLFAF